MKTTRRQILLAVALACALAFATIGAQADDISTRIGRLSIENGQGAGFDFGRSNQFLGIFENVVVFVR